MKTQDHSPFAIAKHPSPVREMYFNAADYAAACKRPHDNRTSFDIFKKHGKINPQPQKRNKQGKNNEVSD